MCTCAIAKHVMCTCVNKQAAPDAISLLVTKLTPKPCLFPFGNFAHALQLARIDAAPQGDLASSRPQPVFCSAARGLSGAALRASNEQLGGRRQQSEGQDQKVHLTRTVQEFHCEIDRHRVFQRANCSRVVDLITRAPPVLRLQRFRAHLDVCLCLVLSALTTAASRLPSSGRRVDALRRHGHHRTC